MDKGKGKAEEYSDSTHSTSGSNIGPLKKPRIDYEAIIDKKNRIIEEQAQEIEYWKQAYMEYSKWAKKEMEHMADKHKGQHHNVKNVASNNRLHFTQLRQNLLLQFDDDFRQVADVLFGIEWSA